MFNPSPLSNFDKSTLSSSSCSPAAINPASPDRPPIPAILPKPVKPPVPETKPALLSKLPKPLNFPFAMKGLKLPLPKNLPNAPLPAKPPNCVPGIPNVKAPNIAALPNGLLTTFFTAFLAFLTIFLIKYDLIPVPLISSPAPPNDFKSAASSGLMYAKDSPGGAILLASSSVKIPPSFRSCLSISDLEIAIVYLSYLVSPE